jgi:TIR domain
MIAISYRRGDSTPIAGRLHDRLRAEFGKENVFMDFDSIPYGVDFRDHIAQTLEGADILVAVIGPGWLGQRPGESTRRIDDATDFVRLEIAGALQRGIPVIPILVDTTPMPKEDTLPDDLKPLVFRNALVLDTGIDFHHHADRLITGVRSLLKNIQPGFARDFENRRSAAGRFKWLDMLDRLRSPAPSQRQDHERDVKPTSLTSAAEPRTAAPKEISAQSGGAEAGARETARSEASQMIERDRDFERYGGGAKERPKKQLVPLAGSAPELPPPVTVPAVSVQKSSIAPPPAPVSIAQRSGAPKKPQNWLFNRKLLALVLAGVLVGFMTYFAVTSKIKSTSTRTKAVDQSAVLAPQSSALITPDVTSSASTAVQPSVQPLASNTPLEVSSPSPPSGVNDRQTTTDNTAIARSGDVTVRAVMRTGPGEWPVTSFTPDTPKLFATFNTKGIKSGDKVRGVLIAEDVGDMGAANTTFFESKETALEKDIDDQYYYFGKPMKGWPVGKYRVEIYVNDHLAETVKFTIEASAATSVSPSLNGTPTPEQTPLLKNGRTWQAWIGDFVRQFVAMNQLKDANATLALYAPTVDYFDDHQADQAFIREDLEKYNVRWPVRQDSIEGDIQLQEKVPEKEYVASFKLNFYAESAPRAIWTKGQFTIDLDINIVDGMPKISGIRQKMLHQQKGKPKSAKPNRPTPAKLAKYPYGISVPGKPGLVKSPYAPSKGNVDVRRYRSGAEVKCPFTGKTFIAP